MVREANTTVRRGAAAGMLAIVPLASLGTADDAAAKKIKVKNTKAHGKGSFHHAAKVADRTAKKDKILFPSRLSGSIATRGETFEEAVAVKSRSRKVRLVEKGKNARLDFASENTNSDPGKPSALKGLRLDGVQVSADDYAELTVTDSTITGDGPENEPDGFGGDGAGVYTYFGDIDVKRSTVSGWTTGVGVYQSSVSITDSVIAGNERGTDNGKGGTQIKRSTITGNSDIGVRAGYYGASQVINSTIAGNAGTATYGAVFALNATIADNRGVSEGYYGLSVQNSIVAGNAGGPGPQCEQEKLETRGSNVFSDIGNCTPDDPADDDLFRSDAGLEPLRDNGGPTPTMALTASSPAVDHADDEAPRTDQRGVRRRHFPDSGAFERKLCGGTPVNVVGTRGADRLRGGPGEDGILAGGGPDRVNGRGGDDAICGGAGKDELHGARGNDLIRGGRGDDRCFGGAGNDKGIGCSRERGIER